MHAEPWPTFDPELARADQVTMVVQVNGKVRDRVEVAPDISEEEAVRAGPGLRECGRALGGAAPSRVVARPPRLVNIVP